MTHPPGGGSGGGSGGNTTGPGRIPGTPLTHWQRRGNYQRQTGRERLTPARHRKVRAGARLSPHRP